MKQIIKVSNLFKIRNVFQKFKIIIKTFRKFNEFYQNLSKFSTVQVFFIVKNVSGSALNKNL